MEAEFSLVRAEDAEKNPVGKAREGPSPLEEPKFDFLLFNKHSKFCSLVVRKRLFFGLHLPGKPFDLLYGEILNGQLLSALLSLFSLFSSFWQFGHYQEKLFAKQRMAFSRLVEVDEKNKLFYSKYFFIKINSFITMSLHKNNEISSSKARRKTNGTDPFLDVFFRRNLFLVE